MPNLFHRLGCAAERIGAHVAACAKSIALHLELHWAEFRGNHNRALKILEQIAMADLTAPEPAIEPQVLDLNPAAQ